MKTINFLKVLLMTLLVLGNAHAARLSTEDKKEVQVKLDELIKESKDDKGVINMERFNTFAFNSLEEFHVDRKITREELIKFKDMLEKVRVNTAPENREKQIKEIFEKNLLSFDQGKPAELVKEGGQCNHWDCAKGLECAPVPPRVEKKLRKKGGDVACTQNSDCNSGECYENSDGKKVCEYTYRCFRPVPLKSSCLENPVCSGGECIEVYFSDSNIGACLSNDNKCKSDVDCCSDSCVKGQCVENYRCDDCVSNGKLKRGQKCCADKAFEKDGKCVPLSVPLNPFVQIFKGFLNIVIPEAAAIEQELRLDEGGGGGGGGGRTGTGTNANQQYRNNINSNNSNTAGGGIDSGDLDFSGQSQIDSFSLTPDNPSNMETCEINLVNDYAKSLRETRSPTNPNVSMLQVELALLGFEFVAGGEGQINDYWKKGGKTLHQRIAAVANKRTQIRKDFYGDLRWYEPKVKCVCLERTGYKQMSEDQREFYESQCRLGLSIPSLQGGGLAEIEEFREKRDEIAAANAMSQEEWNAKITELKRSLEAQEIDEGDDALGIKALELLELWANAKATIEEISIVTTNISLSELIEIDTWMKSEAKWAEVEERNRNLYAFDVKNHAAADNPMLAAGLLAAGAIAIIGGFAFSATVSAWVSIGLITASAASLGAGMWMIGSLRGAWYSAAPKISDTMTGQYKCGKSDTCFKFQRVLHQPYNDVCNKYISASACIKHFVVVKGEQQNSESILVDPWIPKGMGLNDIVKDTRSHADLLNAGYTRAYNYMKSSMQAPSDSKANLHDKSIFENTVITNQALAKYAPDLRSNAEDYIVSDATKKVIVEKAAKYLIDQGWATNETQANGFGEYVFTNHFSWAKQTYGDVISYPQPGLVAYIGLIANGLADQMDNNLNFGGGFRELANSYRGEIDRRNGEFDEDGNRNIIRGDDPNGNDRNILGGGSVGSGIGFGDGNSLGGFGSAGFGGFGNGSGTLTGSTFGDGNFNGSLFGSGVNSALSNLRNFRKDQKDAADEFKKRNSGSERGRRLIEAAKDFNSDFFANSLKGNSLNGSGGSGIGGVGSLASNPNATKLGGDGSNSKGDGSGSDGKSGFFSEGVGRSGGGGGGSSAGANSAGANAFGGYGDYGNGDDGSGGSGFGSDGSGTGRQDNMSEEDARRLAEAIKNRDSKNGKYDRQDGMTLWEIVTNTYIRVYDRLLERKSNDLD